MNLIFETSRLLVREYETSDAEDFIALNGNELVMQYIRPAVNRHEALELFETNLRFYRENPGMGRWAVLEKEFFVFVGSFAILPLPGDAAKMQIGYALMPDAWGKGYASELVERGIPFFFQQQDKEVLYGVTEFPNIASQKVLLKSGFKEEIEFAEGEKQLKRFILSRQDYHL